MNVTPRHVGAPDSSGEVFLTCDPRAIRLLAGIERAARLDLPMLIEGESGTGKDLVARLVHHWSGREREPFVPANVAALPDELFESIVFGHARGAFTGAVESRPGLAAAAGRGTLFLDEIGELSPAAQAKLLRFIDRREYIPLGETKPRRCEARIAAATNRNLAADCAAGRFRRDLYYRLSPLAFRIPPLRERRADIEHLARHFLSKLESVHGLGPFRLHETALEAMSRHSWPGNVRELESEMLRAALAARGGVIRAGCLSPALASDAMGGASVAAEGASPIGATLVLRLRSFERAEIVDALRVCGGNRTEAARLLGMKRTTLIGAMRRLDVEW
jgi:DNA-binding NtrC family response regulator